MELKKSHFLATFFVKWKKIFLRLWELGRGVCVCVCGGGGGVNFQIMRSNIFRSRYISFYKNCITHHTLSNYDINMGSSCACVDKFMYICLGLLLGLGLGLGFGKDYKASERSRTAAKSRVKIWAKGSFKICSCLL